jgi:Protein of unknown function with HXXEE motif
MSDIVLKNDFSRIEQGLTGLAVAGAAALMLATMGRPVIALVIALWISYAIWVTRADWSLNSRIVPALLLAVLIQCVHLGEEIQSGFFRAFPPVMGGEPWSARQFVIFNVVWLAIFLVATFGATKGWRPAYVVTLFLAIGGGIGNGLGHIALAIRGGGYFPGLYTAPFALVIGIALLICHRPGRKPFVAAI